MITQANKGGDLTFKNKIKEAIYRERKKITQRRRQTYAIISYVTFETPENRASLSTKEDEEHSSDLYCKKREFHANHDQPMHTGSPQVGAREEKQRTRKHFENTVVAS